MNLTKLIKTRHKKYANFTLALQDCSTNAYQNVEFCNMIADKTLLHIKKLNAKPFTLNPTNVFLLAAINQYIAIHSAKKINVLDFGGACGAHYFETKRFIPDRISLNWQVVDTPQMALSAKEKNLNHSELYFFDSLNKVTTKIDFLHSSSTLQYVPDPYQCLQELLQLKANFLFFNRMMFNENDSDFITVQKSHFSGNGPGPLPQGYTDKLIAYPHTTISFKKFNTMLLNSGYHLEWIFEESTGNFPINNEKIIGRGLLYTKP